MKKLRYIIAFSLLVLGGSGAELRAQTPPNPPATSWYPPPSVQPPTLAVTNASARVALPAAPTVYPVVTVVNVGAQEIFCRLGDATVTVTTASYEFAIPGNNGYRAVWDASSAYVACITASSTSTARITQSNGGPTLGFNGAPASLPPSGAAGGDLAGTYPNPTVVNLSNVTNASLANSGLANSSMTIAGHAVSLGGTQAIACADLSNGATGCSTATGTSGATIPLLNGANTWSGAQTINGASFGLTGNITGAAIFGTSGIRYKNVAGTLSDTTSSGTVATNYDSKFGGNTLTATNATTITNNFGSYFTAPVCSTNVTCTNNYALGVDSLKATNTTTQMRLAYDGSDYTDFTVGSTGGLTLGGAGGGTGSMTAPGGSLAGGVSVGFYNSNVIAFPSTGILAITSGAVNGTKDTGLTRDSVLGAGNLDLGNGSANDKSGTLNAAKVALGGCTIGTDNFCITGPMSVSGQSKFLAGVAIGSATTAASQGVSPSGSTTNVNGGGSGALVHLQDNSGNVYLEATTGLATFGGPAAAAPTAQTIAVQSVLAGTSNTAGVVTTIKNSAGTGTALGGNTIFQYAPHDTTHTVNTFTGSASPYTIGFTAGNITTYPIGTVMTVSGCTTATLNGTYTVTASSSGSVTATTTATGTGSPTTCLIVGNTSQNAYATALTINGDTAALTAAGNLQAANLTSVATITAGATGNLLWNGRSLLNSPADGTVSAFFNDGSTYGALKFASLITAGTAPVGSGTCTRGTQTGGLTAGSIVLTCTAQTLILTFTTTAPNGWMCEAIDQTTTADTMKQTANSTTTCTLTGTTAASDVVIYQARAY